MKQIITIALLILLPIRIYSQTLQKDYLDGIEKHLSEGNCEQAERVYRAGTKNNEIEVDKDIESRIAECKGYTISTKTNILYQSHNGHEYVDLGLSVKWATCNVGAYYPDNLGKYYAWGETTTWSLYRKYNSKKFDIMKDISGKSKYDVARATWGGTWRLPTREEFEELIQCCRWTWITQNGVEGYKVTSRRNGNFIFLPAAGYIDEVLASNDLEPSLYDGCYWSSSPSDDSYNAYLLYFNYKLSECEVIDSLYMRDAGLSVRPVCE